MNIKAIIKMILVPVIFLTFYQLKTFAQQSDFTGQWLINQDKSNFSGQPLNTMYKQLNVSHSPQFLKVEGVRYDASTAPTIISYPLNGNVVETNLSGNRKMTAFLKWFNDKKFFTRFLLITYRIIPARKITAQKRFGAFPQMVKN